jgi:hypothetical protein
MVSSIVCVTQTLAKEKLLAAPVVDASGTAVGVVSVLHFVSYFVRHFSAEELQGDDWNALVAKKNHLLGKRINEIPGRTQPFPCESGLECSCSPPLTFEQICRHSTRRT